MNSKGSSLARRDPLLPFSPICEPCKRDRVDRTGWQSHTHTGSIECHNCGRVVNFTPPTKPIRIEDGTPVEITQTVPLFDLMVTQHYA